MGVDGTKTSPGISMTFDRDRSRGRLADTYRRYGPDAVRLAYLMTGDRALAEDLAQEAFARMAARLAFLREPDASWPYLRRIVVNLAKNHYRHRDVERAWLSTQRPGGTEASVEDGVVAHEAMRRALLGLPSTQRAALVLRFYEDLPEDEIAQILGCRPGTVRSLVSRATAALRSSDEVVAYA
jgi:RNA polymerase sigma-70 factor (sigma-E family)